MDYCCDDNFLHTVDQFDEAPVDHVIARIVSVQLPDSVPFISLHPQDIQLFVFDSLL